MVSALSYRGPDGIDTYIDGSVALAQLWMRTTPESLGERAPFTSPSGCVVVGDVRLDNRDELLGLLGVITQSRRGTPVGDLEIVGRAFDRWGVQSIRHLLGDFALAVWDGRAHALHLARDAFGIRPLCWSRVGNTFVFSSQPTGVLAHPAVPRVFDEHAIADQLMFRAPGSQMTYFSQISRVPPAHTLSVTSGGVSGPTRYWSLPTEELRLGSDEEYEEAFRGLLFEAVRSRLRSSGEVGFDLSGGLDSSSVVGAARTILGDETRIRTYAISLGGVSDTDPHHRQSMAAHAGTVHVEIPAESAFDRVAVRGALGAPDDPYSMEGHLFQGAEYLAAVGDGVRVLLGGVQGDAVVLHGFHHLVDLLLSGRWVRLRAELKAYAQHTGIPWTATFLEHAIRPLVPERLLEIRRHYQRRLDGLIDVEYLASDTFLANVGMKRRASWSPETTRLPALRAAHRDLLQEVARDGLMDCLDSWSARAGVELRHPYTDRRLVEFCFALPGNQHFRRGWPRWIQRQGIEGLVPDSIRWRVDKGRFAGDFHSRVLSADWSEVTRLAKTGGSIRNYVDLTRLRTAYSEVGKRPRDAAGPLLWALWLDRFVAYWTNPVGTP
jgi:asparagine synthase (glutamine-hydrolysing)